MKKQLLFIAIFFLSLGIFAQETQGPSSISQAVYKGKTEALSSFPATQSHNFGIDELTIVPNRYEGSFDNLVEGQSVPAGTLQREMGPFLASNTVGANFPGIDNTDSGFLPPDPTGAVGPNHYVQAVNSSIAIYSKTGDLLVGPVALGTFLGNASNSGDPIILYDQLADRWIVSEFGNGAQSLLFAVSETPDPTGAYNLYEILNGQFEDYPHYSIWPDGYYLTTNGTGGGGGFGAREIFVLERDAMLAGDADAQVIGLNLTGQFANPTTIFSAAAANLIGTELPPADAPAYLVYLQDDSWTGSITEDHLLVWEANVDYDNPANSTISANPQEIPVDAFDSLFAQFGVGEINQPGTGQELAGQGGIISYNANYRSFEDHNSWLITFNVDVDGDDTSGIRWIELRNTDADDTWSVYQEGTYAPDDGNSRFMSSAAMDEFGNIGLAFNIGGSNMPVGIRHTGRFKNDPLGQMTVEETVIFDGAGVQTFSNRFGDYAHLTMDPDDVTFWHTSEYFLSDNVWATRIASFQLTGGFANDVGVTSFVSPSNGDLTATETVEVVIRNFGTEAQSNIPLELRVDGVLVASETFTGTIPACDIANYTFTQTVDLSVEGQTYTIEATTVHTGDEQNDNDAASIEVTHLLSDDVGATAITAPTSGELDIEDVTISITNFGGVAQSNFEVQYILDSDAPVVETFTGNVLPEETVSFTFATQATIPPGAHTIVARTNLGGDLDPSNDETSVELFNICMPTANNGCNVDGIKQFILNTINADDGGNGCNTEPASSPQGYANRTDLSTTLSNVAGQNEYVLQAQQNWTGGPGVEALSVWIDFNDNGDFEASEQLIAGEFFQEVATLEDFNLVIPVGAPVGSHILRAKAIDTSAAGDINNACSDFAFGEVQDYTVIIDDTLGLNDQALANSEFTISTLDNENFEVALTSTLEGNVFIGVYNTLGQQLKYKQVQRDGNVFRVSLDMSNVASGVYFVKMNTLGSKLTRTQKIIVK